MFVDGEGVERYSYVQQVAPSRRSGGGGHVVAVFLVMGMQWDRLDWCWFTIKASSVEMVS